MLLLENLTCTAEADAITFTAIHFLVNHKLSPKTSSFEVNSRRLFNRNFLRTDPIFGDFKIQYFYIVANTFFSDTQNINRFLKNVLSLVIYLLIYPLLDCWDQQVVVFVAF